MVILSLLILLLATFSTYEITIKFLEIYVLLLSFFLSKQRWKLCQKCILNNRVTQKDTAKSKKGNTPPNCKMQTEGCSGEKSIIQFDLYLNATTQSGI
jgi:hypothetical protein